MKMKIETKIKILSFQTISKMQLILHFSEKTYQLEN